jgi:HEPN domain-containing protein
LRPEATLWLRLSDTDLETARRLLDIGIYYASVFFAQQSAEKALKALWIAGKEELAPRTHNLMMLARELGGDKSIVEAAAELAPEYVLTRYVTPEVALPDELYSEQSARIHLAAAQAIRDWVASQLD